MTTYARRTTRAKEIARAAVNTMSEYWINPEFRQRMIDQSVAWNKANRERHNAHQRKAYRKRKDKAHDDES